MTFYHQQAQDLILAVHILPIIFSYQMQFYAHLATVTEKQWGLLNHESRT
jgi:hypothetical protein